MAKFFEKCSPELIAALRKLREAKDCAVGLAAVTRSEATE